MKLLYFVILFQMNYLSCKNEKKKKEKKEIQLVKDIVMILRIRI